MTIERFAIDYNTFRNFVFSVIDRIDTNVWIFEETEYYACYCKVGENIYRRNVKKGTSEETLLLSDDWNNIKPDVNSYSRLILTDDNFTITTHGQRYNLNARPSCKGEIQSISTDIVKTLSNSSSDEGILQMFKASTNNIKNIEVLLQGEATVAIPIDEFEYSSNSNLRNIWHSSDTNYTQCFVNTNIPYSGNSCMEIYCDRNKSPGDYVRNSFSDEDWSNISYISFQWQSSLGDSKNVWKIRIYDGTNYAESTITSILADTWEEQIIQLSSMNNIDSLDLTKISRIEFQCVYLSLRWQNVFVDAFHKYSAAGQTSISLYDFGTNNSPTNLSDGTLMTLDDGQISKTMSIIPNPKVYNFNTLYGIENISNALTIGNYYGIFIAKPSSDAVKIYGSSTKSYNSSNLYDVSSSNNLTSTTKSIFFEINTIVDTLLTELNITFDGNPQFGELRFPIIDLNTSKTLNHLGEFKLNGIQELHLNLDSQISLIQLKRNLVLFIKYFDDLTSEVTKVHVRTKQRYQPIERNG